MLGTNRVNTLTPIACNGNWGHAVGTVFGFTLIDTVAPPVMVLNEVRAFITDPTGTETEEIVHTGAAFTAAWAGAGSAWALGIMTMDRAVPLADGTRVRFRVKATDGTPSVSFMSWFVGIGDAPKDNPPVVGSLVKTSAPAKLWRILRVDGSTGDKYYNCQCCDRTVVGTHRLKINDFVVVGPRDILDSRIVVSE